jgi:pimeloyl-ACP methyl ester carboxylesterase
MSLESSPGERPQILTRANAPSIAYRRRVGTAGRAPGVIFLIGFKSDMDGAKASAIDALCAERGQPFLRFDYRGHGRSEGRFEDGDIGTWFEDSLHVLDQLTEGPQVLVGSSMGGWMMLLLALARPDRIAGLVGIAAAPDFTEDLIVPNLPAAERARIERDGSITLPSEYGEGYVITRGLLEAGRRHLVLRQPIAFIGPVRLLHGMADDSVPWQRSLKLQDTLASGDVEVILVKSGDHRLSDRPHLALLNRTLAALLDQLQGSL